MAEASGLDRARMLGQVVGIDWLSERQVDLGEHSFDLYEFELGGVSFELSEVAGRKSTVNRFALQKNLGMLERYLTLVAELPARRVLELGIFRGGSVAFLALLPETEVVMAVDLDDWTDGALVEMSESLGLEETIRPSFGVDQSDRAALARVLDEAEVDQLDLVLDDASHQYVESVASFDFLFPRVRPGGAYVIEDWRWAHPQGVDLGGPFAKRANTPMTQMVFELVMACGTDADIIESVDVLSDMVIIRRGPAVINPDTFRLSEQYDEISALLLGDWTQPSDT